MISLKIIRRGIGTATVPIQELTSQILSDLRIRRELGPPKMTTQNGISNKTSHTLTILSIQLKIPM
jgi:hypothetical protein